MTTEETVDFLADLEPDYVDPPPDKRAYYRNTKTGQRGYVVSVNGVDMIRPDVSGYAKLEMLDEEWRPERVNVTINRMQAAEIAHAADQRLAKWMGRQWELKTEWLSMHDEERIRFANDGPDEGEYRQGLWKLIMRYLGC